MSPWEGLFRPAEYGPIVDAASGPWRTLTHPRDTAPEDLAACEVLHFLRHDAKLQRVFEDKFDRTHGPINNLVEFPRCCVHVSSSTPLPESPTGVVLTRVGIVVSTFWDLTSLAPIPDGAASISTLMGHVVRVLRAPKNRVLTVVWNGSETALAENEMAIEPMEPGIIDGLPDRNGITRPMGTAHNVDAKYLLKIDRNTGQLTRLGSPPT